MEEKPRQYPSEYDQLLRKRRDLLQQTAREQDILDGGTGKKIYSFTIEDAIDDTRGDESAANSKNIRHLFNEKGNTPKHSKEIYRVLNRINRRVERTLANPTLTSEQESELFALSDLTIFALFFGNPLVLKFAQELIDLTNPLMMPDETSKEEK